MEIAHIVPPRWAKDVGYRSLMITFVPWIKYESEYVRWLHDRPGWCYLILNHSMVEKDLRVPRPERILAASQRVQPNLVVLPDVLGDPQETVRRSKEAYPLLDDYRRMFVPQARDMEDWLDCYEEFLTKPVVIGLSSLRRKTGLRGQKGSRIPMLDWMSEEVKAGHLLGLNSVEHFFEKELPMALKGGARSLDTCQAFALAIRDLKFNVRGPRVFLGDLSQYDAMTKEQLNLAMENISLFEEACNESREACNESSAHSST